MAVYGRASLVSDFKLTWENLRGTNKFLSYRALCTSMLKYEIPNRRYQTNMDRTF